MTEDKLAERIHSAIKNGDRNTVEEMVKKEPETVNVLDPVTHNTPLHTATFNREEELASFLVENGADVNAVNRYGGTPLQFAAANGGLKIAKMLIEKGADVNASSNNGNTPLHFAAGNRKESIRSLIDNHDNILDIARLLLENEADASTKNADGLTPLEMAKEKGRKEIEKLLKDKTTKKS